MVKKKWIFPVLAAIALAAGLLAGFLPGEASPYTVDEPYEYPTVPGTEAWNALPGLKEKIEACHVDTALLESMTTPALVETVARYPLLINIHAFDTLEMGVDSVSGYFEGIGILFRREDAADCMRSCVRDESLGLSHVERETLRDLLLYLTGEWPEGC